MSDFRAFFPPVKTEPAEITLSPEESHHLIVVNRASVGNTVVVFDGCGTEWICTLVSARKQAAHLKVNSFRRHPPLPHEITLAQALPKGTAMDAIVRKATEIGAFQIAPLESERTQVHFDRDRSGKKIEKWQTAALEAAKQCGTPFIPTVLAVQNAATFIASASDYDVKLIASLHPGAKSLKTVLRSFQSASARAPKKVLWLIGPEGDFTPAEMSLAESSGFEPITLGPLVLRCETAAIYALSVLSYELQNAD
jgi:16S rRNA (uracil1498-N3)-methyltransferase